MNAAQLPVAISHRDRLPSASRYELLVKIASGGMATVYLGRLSSSHGVARIVAIKRAHAHLVEDPEFARMLVAEAKLAARIHHPNVVAVQHVEEVEGELLLIMDYVEGASLDELARSEEHPVAPSDAVRIVLDACAGLHAAHELTDDEGRPLGIVHRDVSPHNILVGVDGIARLTDFGIAKSNQHSSAGRTSTGTLKGKLGYMPPEYVEGGAFDVRSDVFAMGVVLWETLTRRRLFRGATDIESIRLTMAAQVPRPSSVTPGLDGALDAVVLKALARSPMGRFRTAAELGDALEHAARRSDLLAGHSSVGAHVRKVAAPALARRRGLIQAPKGQAPTGRQTDEDTIVDALPSGRDGATASLSLEPERLVTARLSVPSEERSMAGPMSASQVSLPMSYGASPGRALLVGGVAVFAVALVVAMRFVASREPAAVAPAVSTGLVSAPIADAGSVAAEVRAAAPPEVATPAAAPPTDTQPQPTPTSKLPDIRPRPVSGRAPRPVKDVPTPYDTPPVPRADRAPPNPYAH